MAITKWLVVIAAAVSLLTAFRAEATGSQDQWRSRTSTVAANQERQNYRYEDVAAEIAFGREVAARVIGRYGLYRNPEVERYVNLVGKAVAMQSSRSDLEFRFGILNTSEVNGYAAPGGYVLVTRGALEKMRDESELAGVLAHEIGHITERHAVKELNIRATEGSAMSGFARLIGGGTESARAAFSHAVDRALNMLFKDGYQRGDEVQADRDAVIFAASAGYDPEGLVRYFRRLSAEKGTRKDLEVLDRTHPPFKERIATLTDEITSEGLEGMVFKEGKQRFALMARLFSVELPVPISGIPQPEEEADSNWRQRVSADEMVTSDDVAAEIAFGREVAARVIGRYGLYRNPEVERYVNLVGKAVAMQSSRSDLEFRFGILNTSEVNGYAAPGGYVLVTRGALERMRDESELAGVLGHEIGHITERHAVKELNIRATEGSAMSGFARLIGGGTESARAAFSHAVDRALDMLFKDGYQRGDEVQADRDAVIFAASAGYDPEGLVRYFRRLEAEKGRKKDLEVLDRTHPPFEERIATISWVLHNEGLEGGDFKQDRSRFISEMKDIIRKSR